MNALPRLLALALLLCGCPKTPHAPEPPAGAAPHADEADHEALPKSLRVAEAAQVAAAIRTEPSRRAPLPAIVGLPGSLAAPPDRTAQIASPGPGRIEQVRCNEGSKVKRGDVIAVVRLPDLGRLRGALAATQARLRALRSQRSRLAALHEARAVTEQERVDAEAELQALEAEERSLSGQLDAMGGEPSGGFLLSLRSPLSGVVVQRAAVVGQPVDAQHVVATVVDLQELWFEARVFEKDLGRLRPGARAQVRFNAWPGRSFPAVVDQIGQQLDPGTRTLTARLPLHDATASLRLGLFGVAQVEVEEPSQALPLVLVKRDAVVDVGGKHVVFVRAGDGDFVVHEVAVGADALDEVQILSGLDEGEAVVTAGAFSLKSLLLKSTLTEED